MGRKSPLTRTGRLPTFAAVTAQHAPPPAAPADENNWVPQWSSAVGHRLLEGFRTLHELVAFALITLGVLVRKADHAPGVMRPLIRRELRRAGVQLLPMFLFLAGALGLVVVGQTVAWLSRVGAVDFIGPVMVVAVVRELGPLAAAFIILARVGAANVVELGTARAGGEVEALEAMGIDPVHYLVVPRMVGMAAGTFALTVYLIIGALVSGYLWVFLQDIPLRPEDYFQRIAAALSGLDFVLLALKTGAFGSVMAVVTCYHGLARPLRVPEVSRATVRAVSQSVVACVMVDAFFIVVYLTVG